MSPEFWQEVEAVFSAAVEKQANERAFWLDERCAGRPDLRAEVDALLTAHSASGGFLDTRAYGTSRAAPHPVHSEIIGGFRLLEVIGRGGMGEVYRAERIGGEFSQQVAIKVMAATTRSDETLRRFRAERQILAGLSHPHIVALLDGGLTDRGEAYLVMEHVEGVSLTRHASDRRLGLYERLTLFRQVCSAVHYAHQHGVVHRDLKPGNILVTPDGIAKVLDFGVAKLVDVAPGADVTATGLGAALTPNYASPEQLRGLAVTTASDIYALGIVLYELVARRPYDVTGLALDDAIARVRAGGHARPSGAAERTALPYPAAALRGDLDAVVMKAMAVEPERRYASAEELGADLARVVAREGVTAREPTLGYVIGSLARRHRAAVVATAITVAALVSALGVSIVQTRRAVAERNRSDQRFNELRQLANALIFKIHDSVRPLPGSTEARKLIVAEALTYLERLSAEPTADRTLQHELARGYLRVGTVQGRPSVSNLGDRQGGLKSLSRAAELLEPLAADAAAPAEIVRDLVEARNAIADIQRLIGNRQEALASLVSAVSAAEQLVARDPDEANRRALGSTLFQQALTMSLADSLGAWNRTLGVFETLLAGAPGDPVRQRNVALVHKQIGSYWAGQHDEARAVESFSKALDLDQRRLDAWPSDRSVMFDVAIDLANLANEARKAGNHAESASLYFRSLELRRKVADADPKDVQARSRLAYGHRALSDEYGSLGRHQLALRHARAAVAITAELAPLDDYQKVDHARSLSALSQRLTAVGSEGEGCRAAAEATALVKRLREAKVESNLDTLADVERNLAAQSGVCGQRR